MEERDGCGSDRPSWRLSAVVVLAVAADSATAGRVALPDLVGSEDSPNTDSLRPVIDDLEKRTGYSALSWLQRGDGMQAIVDGDLTAESPDKEVIKIEGNWYFPPFSLTQLVLNDSAMPY